MQLRHLFLSVLLITDQALASVIEECNTSFTFRITNHCQSLKLLNAKEIKNMGEEFVTGHDTMLHDPAKALYSGLYGSYLLQDGPIKNFQYSNAESQDQAAIEEKHLNQLCRNVHLRMDYSFMTSSYPESSDSEEDEDRQFVKLPAPKDYPPLQNTETLYLLIPPYGKSYTCKAILKYPLTSLKIGPVLHHHYEHLPMGEPKVIEAREDIDKSYYAPVYFEFENKALFDGKNITGIDVDLKETPRLVSDRFKVDLTWDKISLPSIGIKFLKPSYSLFSYIGLYEDE